MSRTNPLVIRADANGTIGSGHVMRQIALGQAWRRRGGSVVLCSAVDSPVLADRIRAEGFEFDLPAGEPGSDEDARGLVDLCRRVGASGVVVDGYFFGPRYQRLVRSVGVVLLLVDDYAHQQEYHADLLLNQNPGWKPSDYASCTEDSLLLGTRYALIRSEFIEYKAVAERPQDGLPRLLLTLGGADPDNVMGKILAALAMPEAPEFQVLALMGASNPHADALSEAARALAGRVKLVRNAGDMPRALGWADVVVCGGGSTCWEVCLLGKSALSLVLADNQEEICSQLEAAGALRCLGWASGLSSRDIADALAEFWGDGAARARMGLMAKKLVDGGGADRVAERLALATGALP